MGRGRAKAKQTKVARQLKYNSGGIDLERLRDELVHPYGSDDGRGDDDRSANNARQHRPDGRSPAADDEDDPYAGLYDDYEDPYAAAYADEDEDDDTVRR